METVNPNEILYLIQNQKIIHRLLASLKTELVRFMETEIDEDDILESALIGNRSIYEPGHEGSYTPDPGGKMTAIIQRRGRYTAGNIQARVARDIITDVNTVGFTLEKINISIGCLTSNQKPIIDLLADGLSKAEIADKLLLSPAQYKRQESEILNTLSVVSRITRKDFQRIVELLRP